MIFEGQSSEKKLNTRVATKIFEDFGGALCKEFIVGREPVSIIHHTTLGLDQVSSGPPQTY